jgi:hypothetical protein
VGLQSSQQHRGPSRACLDVSQHAYPALHLVCLMIFELVWQGVFVKQTAGCDCVTAIRQRLTWASIRQKPSVLLPWSRQAHTALHPSLRMSRVL